MSRTRSRTFSADDRFGLQIKGGDEFDTIGGFVQTRLGRMPVRGDEVSVDGYVFRVESLHGKRIDRVRLIASRRESESASKAAG